MRNNFYRRYPKYPDDSDYNTNAPSYYEDLARKQKLIELLAKKIWEYEETLDLTLKDIESRVSKRFDEWDLRIEKFPENVETLLQEWLSDGTLDHIINDTIFNWKADKVDLDETNRQLAQKAENSKLGVVENKIDGVDARVDNLVIPLSPENSNIEVSNALASTVKGKNFDTLSKRFEETETETLSLIESGNLKFRAIKQKGILFNNSLEYGSSITYTNAFVYFVKVSAGDDLLFEINDGTHLDRFRLALFDELPNEGVRTDPTTILYEADSVEHYKFQVMNSGYLALFLSLEGRDVPFTLTHDKIPETYAKPYLTDGVVSKTHTDFIANTNNNLYNPRKYIRGALNYLDHSGGLRTLRGSSFSNTRIVYVPIEPLETYTLEIQDHVSNNRYVIATHPNIPDDQELVSSESVINGTSEINEKITFTNNNVDKYLLFYLSNSTFEPIPVQMEKGSQVGEYTEYSVEVDGYKLGDNGFNQPIDNTIYFDVAEIPLDFVAPPQKDVTIGQDFYLTESKHTAIYEIYDELVDKHPNYVTRKLLGQDAFDNNIFQYSFKPTVFESDADIKYTKILLTTGVHANEKTFSYALSQFFTELCDNWKDSPQLEWLRHNIEFLIIPIAVPTGFDDNTRPNRNGVNVNRNFELFWTEGTPGSTNYGGHEPFSEPETKIIQTFIDDNLDAEFYIDCHNFSNRPTGEFLWFLTNVEDDEYKEFANNYSSVMSRRWGRKYNWIPEGKNIAYTSTQNFAGTNTYALQNNIKSYTLEIDYSISLYEGNRWNFNPMNIQIAVEHFGNYIIALMKKMKGKKVANIEE